MSIKDDLKKYMEKIQNEMVPLDEKYSCSLCEKVFHYRPFSCREICNECLLEEEFITVLGFRVKAD